MLFKIEPVPITITQNCYALEFSILELSEYKIALQVCFYNLNMEVIYKGEINLNEEEIHCWQQNELDLMEWIMNRFQLVYSKESLPSFKRKDYNDKSMMNKKQKIN